MKQAASGSVSFSFFFVNKINGIEDTVEDTLKQIIAIKVPL